jgi:hypothetical protein
MDLMRTVRVQRHESSVLHARFPISIRLYRSTHTLETRVLQKAIGHVRLASLRTRVYRSTDPSPPTAEQETAVCLRIPRRHAPVKALPASKSVR